LGDIGATGEGRTELMPTVIVPIPPLRLQVGGFVVEVVFGKMPVMTKHVSPQPVSKKQRNRLANESRIKPVCVCLSIGVPRKSVALEASGLKSICGWRRRVKFQRGEEKSKIGARLTSNEFRIRASRQLKNTCNRDDGRRRR